MEAKIDDVTEHIYFPQDTDDALVIKYSSKLRKQLPDLSRCAEVTLYGTSILIINCEKLESIIIGPEQEYKISELADINLDGYSEVTDEQIQHLITKDANLEKIDLSECHNVTYCTVLHLILKCQKLKSIDVSNCSNITHEFIESIIKEYPNILIK